jgi:hypothetical protein
VERLNSELDVLRKQVSMQDIYIKQLSHHAAGMAEYQAMSESLAAIHSMPLFSIQALATNCRREIRP